MMKNMGRPGYEATCPTIATNSHESGGGTRALH